MSLFHPDNTSNYDVMNSVFGFKLRRVLNYVKAHVNVGLHLKYKEEPIYQISTS